MLHKQCIIEDVHKTVTTDTDLTQRKRRSYGDQYILSVRQDTRRCVCDHFPTSGGRETVRDLIIVQDDWGGGGGDESRGLVDVFRRLEPDSLKTVYLVDCAVSIENMIILESASLTVLILSHCRIRRLPSCIFEMTTLEVLKVDHNCIEEISEELGGLSHLRTFCCDAQRPRLRSLPESITRLDQLEILSVCDNRIESISWTVALPNLKILRCASNRIYRLPTQLVNLSKLIWLDVSHNRIEHVPRSLFQLIHRLIRFDFFNLSLQPRRVRLSKSALLSHLKLENFLAGAADPVKNYVSDLTVMILGETGSGKSTLVQALKDDRGICRQELRSSQHHPLEIHRFDMCALGGLLNDSWDTLRPQTGTTPTSTDSSRLNFSVGGSGGDSTVSSRYVTMVVFSGEYLDSYTRDIHADLYMVLVDLTTLEQHHNGSPPHLVTRHLARLQMWLQAMYETSPKTPVLIVGTHADLVKTITFQDVCLLLDELLERGRQHHVRRFADGPGRNCLLCSRRSLAGQGTLTKSRSGPSGFVELASPTGRANGQRGSSLLPTEAIGILSGRPRFPHVVGYYEVDSKKCFPRDSKKVNLSIEQLKGAILRLSDSGSRIPSEWLVFSRQLVCVSEQTQRVPCIQLEDAISVARNFDITGTQVPMILDYFHRRGSLVFFSEDNLLSRLVVVNPVWLLQTLDRALASQEESHVDAVRLYHNLTDRDLDRLFTKAGVQCVNGAQWLMAMATRLEYCAPLGLSSYFFPRLLRQGNPSLDVWPEIPELEERQVAFDVSVRTPRSRMFADFLLNLNNEDGRRSLEILSDPPPVFLSHQLVFFSSLDTGSCEDCAAWSEEEWCGSLRLQAEGECKHKNRVDEVLHKVNIALQRNLGSIRVIVRGPSPCCVMKSTLRFLEQHLNDATDDTPEVEVSLSAFEQSSFRSCSCSCTSEDRESLYGVYEFDDKRNVSLLCPKCVLLRDPRPERISQQTMIPRNKPVCSKWHNLGSWSRAVTGDYRFTSVDRPFQISPVCLPDYEHPRLFMLLPPSSTVSEHEWYSSARVQFFEGFEVHILCENPTYWHMVKGSGIRLRSNPSDEAARQSALFVGLALPMLQLVLGVGEHPHTIRLLAPVISDLLQMYDYLRCVDACTQDPYAWLTRYKDRLVAMLAKVLANVTSAEGGPQQHPDVYVKTGSSLGPDDLLQASPVASREDLCRFLRLETSSGRFGCLRPIYVGREIRWVCEAHHEELRSTASVQFHS